MPSEVNDAWFARSRWTIASGIVVLMLNVGLFPAFGGLGVRLLAQLQFDGAAIQRGEVWRILTGHVVHWDANHFLFDFTAFVILGLLYERHMPRSYPYFLLWLSLWVGVAEWMAWPPETLCRGLSGVTAGQFAAALAIEIGRARKEPQRWLWVGPAATCYAFWLGYGAVTGKALFTSGGGDVAVLAHLVGAGAGVAFWVVRAGMTKKQNTSGLNQ